MIFSTRCVGAITQGQTRWCASPQTIMDGPGFYAALANSMVAGDATPEALATRLADTLGRQWRWIRPLARRYLARFTGARPRRKKIVQFLKSDEGLRRALRVHRGKVRIARWVAPTATMQPVRAARTWGLPAIESMGALAEWLQVTPGELEWFADLKRMIGRLGEDACEGPLSHYHYRILGKPGGDLRLIEAPKPRLKEIQRRILTEILERIPVHPAVHGFRRGRSIRSFAAPHVRQRVVVRMDLRDFFPSISGPRVQAMFRVAGYPERVANLLGGLCTNAVPAVFWNPKGKGFDPFRVADARHLYSWPHLPQGAPTSPSLANICAYRLDCRLAGLAESCGAVYTRYADDLAFSGGRDFERITERFVVHAAAILIEEGFTVHHRKTRIMRQGVRQYLAGVVTNEHVNVIRRDYDLLKATLTNCRRYGPESQNREGLANFREHLKGRVSFVEMINARKGAKLKELFDRIVW